MSQLSHAALDELPFVTTVLGVEVTVREVELRARGIVAYRRWLGE